MAEYSEVEGMIPSLKRAAIDAYMRTQHYPWTIEGSHYVIDTSDTETKVTRPGPDGEGGGDWSSDNFIGELISGGSQDEKFDEAFDSIRSRIDAAIEPWLNLPEPTDIAGQVEELRQITRRLSGAAAASGGGQTGAGVIPGNIGLIVENTDAMSGSAIAAFKSSFLAQLGPVIGGMHGISLVLGGAMASEEGIWTAARQTVADAVAGALSASESLAASGSSGSPAVALAIAGWAAKGAKIFVPGAGPVLEVAGLGIEIISGSTEVATEEKTIDGSDAVAVLEKFEQVLSELNARITTEEEALNTNITTNLANVRADTSSYDLTVPPVRDSPDDASDVIIYQPDLIAEITKTYLPAIATELTGAADLTIGTAMSNVTIRDGSVGIGTTGPSGAWAQLRYLLYELLKNLSWDVTVGGTNLDLVMQDMTAREEHIAQEIERVLAQLDAGNPTDPWN